MGNAGSGAAGGMVPYAGAGGLAVQPSFNYVPYYHPGSDLLPAQDLMKFDTLPASVLGQISADGSHYDLYGKSGAAFEDSMIDAPVGKAARDYTAWLEENPTIATEIDALVKTNANKLYGDLEWKDVDGTLVPVQKGATWISFDDFPPLSEPTVNPDNAVEVFDMDEPEETSKPGGSDTKPDEKSDGKKTHEDEWW